MHAAILPPLPPIRALPRGGAPPPRPSGRGARCKLATAPLAVILAALWLAVSSQLASQGVAQAAPQAFLPGQQVVLQRCLRFTVEGFTDRNAELAHHDWVSLKVTNECDEPRRHLLVDLVLLDPLGNTYGSRVWVLLRGELLLPGQLKTGRYPIPDPDNKIPRMWALRVVKVEKPRPRKPAPTPVPALARGRGARKR